MTCRQTTEEKPSGIDHRLAVGSSGATWPAQAPLKNSSQIVALLSDLKHRVFPRSFERLAVHGTDLVGVEIGVYQGFHAESLLRNLSVKILYLVDPYQMYAEYREGQEHYGVNREPLEQAKIEAMARLAPYARQISWIGETSAQAVADIPDGLDFVYVDGNHEEQYVREDIAGYYAKLKVGGIIGGHDFYNGFCRGHDGVVRAVTQFAVQNNLTLQVELPDWWLEKTA